MIALGIMVALAIYAVVLTIVLYRSRPKDNEESGEEGSSSPCGTHCRCPGDGQKDP